MTNIEIQARNIIFLYARQFIILCFNLIISKLIFQNLGIVNFGILNTVSSIVMLLSVFSATITFSLQKFLTEYHFRGREFLSDLLRTCILLLIISVIALAFVYHFFLEKYIFNLFSVNQIKDLEIKKVGLYVFYTFISSIFLTLFQNLLIATGRMNLFAKISIFDVLLRLLFLIFLITFEFVSIAKISGVLLLANLFVLIIYISNTRDLFGRKGKYIFFYPEIANKIITFSGWIFLGCLSNMAMSHGVSVLVATRFSSAIVGARSISTQFVSLVITILTSFQIVINREITGALVNNEVERCYYWISLGSKISYFLLMCVTIPLLMETETIMKIWLGQVPKEAILYARISMIILVVDFFSPHFITLITFGSGNKMYQVLISILLILNLPISWLFIDFGFEATIVLYISLVISFIANICRLWMAKVSENFNIALYLREVLLPIFKVTLSSIIVPFISTLFVTNRPLQFAINFVLSPVVSVMMIYFLGFHKEEKEKILSLFKKKVVFE